MASEAQSAANRRNARNSTGPRTEAGKAASSRNAIRHGLASAQLILFDERQDDFERFYDDLRTAHAPADAAEDGLVERIAMASWRLRRVWRAEAAAVNAEALALARYRACAAARDAIAAELKIHPLGGKPMTPDEVRLAARDGADALSDNELEEAMTLDPVEGDEGFAAGRVNTVIWPARLTDLSRYEAASSARSAARRASSTAPGARRQMAIAAAKAAAEEMVLDAPRGGAQSDDRARTRGERAAGGGGGRFGRRACGAART